MAAQLDAPAASGAPLAAEGQSVSRVPAASAQGNGALLAAAPEQIAWAYSSRAMTPSSMIANSRSCTISATAEIDGYIVEEVARYGDTLSYSMSAPTSQAIQAGGAEYDRCHAEYFRDVAVAWGLEAAFDRLLPLWEKMAACMNAHGVAVPADANWTQMRDASAAAGQPLLWQDCTPRD